MWRKEARCSLSVAGAGEDVVRSVSELLRGDRCRAGSGVTDCGCDRLRRTGAEGGLVRADAIRGALLNCSIVGWLDLPTG